ncbi:hypothetical protein MTO96_032453 [Rhipicephalus appendiculatus]
MMQAPAIHILNLLRYQHRRLLLATAEAGLAGRHRRHEVAPTGDRSDEVEPFFLYFVSYSVGCAISSVAVAGEILVHAYLRRRA